MAQHFHEPNGSLIQYLAFIQETFLLTKVMTETWFTSLSNLENSEIIKCALTTTKISHEDYGTNAVFGVTNNMFF